ncbi:uncharacterized protein LOC100903094 [Galendromus occidentalis]|uniref:Kynureninase n=1 Tax=Galendromus occidentalis TaxID=34638 RepID=A0AAJ6W078_9ACAR|nr:uncharacterized protein LOC100903094 [Galendromus occidentalis]
MEEKLLAELSGHASRTGYPLNSEAFARAMDETDELRYLREEFRYPKMKDLPCTAEKSDEECVYFCGHSLGLMPRSASSNINRVLESWAQMGVEHHAHGYLKAAYCELSPKNQMARLAGCHPEEVVIMNGLTVNLHLLMLNFYRPSSERYKILIEGAAFPSDMYAVKSQLALHGYSVEEGLIQLEGRGDSDIIDEEDIVEVLRCEGSRIALVVLPTTQYYTGQVFDIGMLTEVAHQQGCLVLCDAAHSIGNVTLKLHEWDVDCAVWCSYKYLNSGAGGAGAAFIHRRHLKKLPAVHGWWGNDTATKFLMKRDFEPVPNSADMYKLSNAPPVLIAPMMASLDIFDRACEGKRLRKQRLLTGFLEYLLLKMSSSGLPLIQITPRDPNRRGSMLCVKLSSAPENLHSLLQERGVVCDVRQPGVIRITPCPLYNSFMDVWRFAQILGSIPTDSRIANE